MSKAILILSKTELEILRKKPGDEAFRGSFKFPRRGWDQILPDLNRLSNIETESCYSCLVRLEGLSQRARLHDIRIELKPVWNLKLLWNVVPFTWQFTWRFPCTNFPNNSKALLHLWKWYPLINANLINPKKCYQWYLLIDANLINAKQMLRYWLFFKQ